MPNETKEKVSDRILIEELHEFLTQDSSIPKYLISFVRNRIKDGTKSVALCFRGEAATFYYRCHQLLKISCSRKTIIGEFNFRHARFTEKYREHLKELEEIGVDISNFSDEDGKSSRAYVRVDLQSVSVDNLEKILKLYIKLIDDFLDPSKVNYCFDKKPRRGKSANLEKDRQQQLYATYFLNNDLLYYDLEYKEPNRAADGKYDLLGLRRDGDGYTLLLTELKSTHEACKGHSGVEAHVRDYIDYLSKSELIEARKVEAYHSIKLLFEIFDKHIPENLCIDNIKNVKIKFVFSDSAIGYGATYKFEDPRIEKVQLDNISGLEKPY